MLVIVSGDLFALVIQGVVHRQVFNESIASVH